MRYTRHAAFILRCAGAASLAYLLASALGLSNPAWASISGIIVSQEKLAETGHALAWRLAGTLIGVATAVVVGDSVAHFGGGVAVQMAISVALCAMLARRYPVLRVCMWTCPIVFLTTSTQVTLPVAGFDRGLEVVLGGMVGAALHLLAELFISSLSRVNRRPALHDVRGARV